ncbi:MAG: DUF1894 domain-containing protein [Methanothrix sp.]|nr:DUF1894 domain-containing protein [Methanothrix sp.]
MSCFKKLDKIKHEVLLERATFSEAREFIEKNSDEVYHVLPGYRLFHDCYLVGVTPIALGIKDSDLIFPLVRPRLGTFVIRAGAEEEVRRLKETGVRAP